MHMEGVGDVRSPSRARSARRKREIRRMNMTPRRAALVLLLAAASAAVAAPSSTLVSTSIPPRVLPNGTLAVSITLKNTGNTTWTPGSMQLTFTGDAAAWPNASFALDKRTTPNKQATFTGSLQAGQQIGRHRLSWQPTVNGDRKSVV